MPSRCTASISRRARCRSAPCCRSRPVPAPRIAPIARRAHTTRPGWKPSACCRSTRWWRRRRRRRPEVPAASAWARPGASPATGTWSRCWRWCRPSRPSAWRPASPWACSPPSRPAACGTPGWTTTTTISIPRPSSMARSSAPAPSRTAWTPSPMSATPASTSVPAASSAWARTGPIGPACCRRWPTCRVIPRVSRSICWCASRVRRWPGSSRRTRSSSCAPSRWPGA